MDLRVPQERGNTNTSFAVTVKNSTNVVIRELTQHMAGSFCFFDSGNYNTTFDRCEDLPKLVLAHLGPSGTPVRSTQGMR